MRGRKIRALSIISASTFAGLAGTAFGQYTMLGIFHRGHAFADQSACVGNPGRMTQARTVRGTR